MTIYILTSGEPDSEIYGVFASEAAALAAAAASGPPANDRYVRGFDLAWPGGADPIALLRRLTGFGWRPDPDNEAVLVCRYCNETVWIVERGEHELRHEHDCPWVAAKAFLDGLTELRP